MAVLSYCFPAFGGETIHNQIGIPLSMRKNRVDVIFPDITSFIMVYQRDNHKKK